MNVWDLSIRAFLLLILTIFITWLISEFVKYTISRRSEREKIEKLEDENRRLTDLLNHIVGNNSPKEKVKE